MFGMRRREFAACSAVLQWLGRSRCVRSKPNAFGASAS